MRLAVQQPVVAVGSRNPLAFTTGAATSRYPCHTPNHHYAEPASVDDSKAKSSAATSAGIVPRSGGAFHISG